MHVHSFTCPVRATSRDRVRGAARGEQVPVEAAVEHEAVEALLSEHGLELAEWPHVVSLAREVALRVVVEVGDLGGTLWQFSKQRIPAEQPQSNSTSDKRGSVSDRHSVPRHHSLEANWLRLRQTVEAGTGQGCAPDSTRIGAARLELVALQHKQHTAWRQHLSALHPPENAADGLVGRLVEGLGDLPVMRGR